MFFTCYRELQQVKALVNGQAANPVRGQDLDAQLITVGVTVKLRVIIMTKMGIVGGSLKLLSCLSKEV